MKHIRRLFGYLVLTLLIAACSEVAVPDTELQPLSGEIEISSAQVNLPTDGVFPQAVGGQPFTITVRLSDVAPAGGVEVGVSILRVNSFVASFGGSGGTVVVPEGERTTDISIETFPVTGLNTESISVSTDSSDTTSRSRERFLIELQPDPERPVQVFEAEEAALEGAFLVDEVGSFSGDAAVEFPPDEVTRATFDVDVDEAGAYLLVLGYADVPNTPVGEPRTADITVNGEASRLTLPSAPGTGGGSGVRNEGVSVVLNEGRNVIELSADGDAGSGGLALDRLNVVAEDLSGDDESGESAFPEPGVDYALRNAATNTYLDTNPDGGLNLARDADGADKRFRLEEVDGAYFVINQRADRGALDTRPDGVRWVTEETGGDDKRWALIKDSEGYRLDNLRDGRGYLVATSSKIVLSNEASEASMWFFEQVD